MTPRGQLAAHDDFVEDVQPVALGHVDVEHRHIRLQRHDPVQRRAAVIRFADDLEAVAPADRPDQAAPVHRMVVGDEDADAQGLSSGSAAGCRAAFWP